MFFFGSASRGSRRRANIKQTSSKQQACPILFGCGCGVARTWAGARRAQRVYWGRLRSETPDEIIENPILNSPFEEPNRHFRFTDEGITNEIVETRRISSYFIPIPPPKKKGKQREFETEWTQDRIEENEFVNRIRRRVGMWRQGGHVGVTAVSSRLLEYWRNPERENKLFFCQIEALETAIYLNEVARKYGDAWIENDLRAANDSANPGLPRVAYKMATGSGKTVVMAMLIAWQTLNKLANPQDARFSDAFLIVSPGITIRDRLRVLFPNDPGNYYRLRNVVPGDLHEKLERAKIVVTNFHAFQLREMVKAGKITKQILGGDKTGAFKETPAKMVRRVLRALGNKRNIVVINDEAHHCYRRKPDGEEVRLKGDERKEAEKRDEEARVWISGIEVVRDKLGVRRIFDLSATPFFLRGSGYSEGTLFPWVVSDFSLIDAIESGVVKIPRVPVADDTMQGEMPTYRDLWLRIRDDLPKKGRKTGPVGGEPKLPKELEGALHSLYANYEKYYKLWEKSSTGRDDTPPVFIVVCNNTNVSKIVYDYVSGWTKTLPDESTVVVPGKLPIFDNTDGGRWRDRPNTILVDSEQLESGEAMSAEFKKIAALEIEEFKNEYRDRFPERDVEKLTDEDLLREVMNTVGKAGKLGEHVTCVVSVSMLIEGWDANTVTHVLGVRAFGTQLLCEQVVGRALRRISYAANDEGKFMPEYAEVYGVPFSFIPCSGSTATPEPGPKATRVRALEDRLACEVTFPRIVGYRYEIGDEQLSAKFTPESRFELSSRDLALRTEMGSVVGEFTIHTLDDLKRQREQQVVFQLARVVLETYFRDGDDQVRPWFFPQLLSICRRWLDECVVLQERQAFKQLLLLTEFANDAADRIYQSIVRSSDGTKTLKAIPRAYDKTWSTRYVDFDTTKAVYQTRPDKCQVSHVVGDTESWEQKMAQVLETMPEVVAYVKNQGLDFAIPYMLNGEQRNYWPDFLVRYDDGRGPDDLLNIVIEVSGEARKDKAIKVETAKTLWVPAVNNHGAFGRWAFVEVRDPWKDAEGTIRRLR